MATFTQEKRLLAVSTPLGKDVFLLTGFSGREEISRLFNWRPFSVPDRNAEKRVTNGINTEH